MSSSPHTEHVLTLDCPEAPGIVHAVSRFLLEHGSDIIDNQQFGDRRDGHFFMRVRFATADGETVTGTLRRDFAAVAAPFAMRWHLEPVSTRRRVLVMVSRYGHCLNDLLFRTRSGDLPVDVVAVVSNHRDHEALVAWHGIPFFHVPVTPATKPEAEARLLDLVDSFDVDLVVLARYMQVLSDGLCSRLAGRAINIHHSFLPSFKGAKPYHQAHERGVKLVGATAHYVTADLDEGPIIAQEVKDVDHSHTPEDLAAIGRDAESAALARAVRWHCEGRVFVQGRRTVILR
ncbi:formyltetrahydrofolate deformylase [Streptomyces violarus]|uniref:Formyltetrahydrofolate deformylase n=1 Tax=Streptomyces violarus TaxID=67380 RepID=A0A7W5F5L0_9ACTN|nr:MULTISPECIES: formyltetrahydrofolate deformylase [Streptomyces]MBB3081002.1 formyltetrahydrofolate deformylase [Streptomyces violarus]WRU02882.1 formyltetrahydrofolate deformylase [Streptomyces sp. CGMCC 4.1772]GHD28966.1 formyltetrahydrofolate deformylase [Streptomyces violarus]